MRLKLDRPLQGFSPSIGNPIMVKDARNYGVVSEEFIEKSFVHNPILNKDGDIVVPANGYQEPLNFEEIYLPKSEKDICGRWGIQYSPKQTENNSQQEEQYNGGQNYQQPNNSGGAIDLDDDMQDLPEERVVEQKPQDDNGFKDDEFDDDIPF